MGTPHGPHPVTHAPLPIAKSLHQETALTTLVDQPKAAIMSDRLNFHHEKKKKLLGFHGHQLIVVLS